MARTNNLANFLTDVAGAIKTKKGDNTPILASSFDTEIENLPSGGANIVNGIIEQYLAESTTVDANTFVEFINHFYNDETLVDGKYAGLSVSAVLIDTNKVFIAHRSGGSDTSTYNYLNGIVCTINGNTITTGSDTTLVSGSNAYNNASAVLIDTNKVFIAHRSGSYSTLRGIVCEISGTTITAGTDTNLVNVNGAYLNASAVLIDTNKVFIAHQKSDSSASNYLNGIVCTVSGTTITTGTDTTLVSVDPSSDDASAVLIDTNKVFIAHRSGGFGTTSTLLNGIVCTVSGTTITAGTDTTLVSANGSSDDLSATLLEKNKVFIVHKSDFTDDYLNGIVCTVSGTTITAGTDTTLVSNSWYAASILLLESNKVFVAYSRSSTLYAIVCTINNTSVIAGTNTNLSSAYRLISAVLIDTNKVFIAHASDSTDQYLNGLICSVNGTDISTVYKAPTIKASETKIQGLTKTQGTTTTQADVWVLNNQ